MKDKINAYWFTSEGSTNWGDDINQYIISKMSGIPLENVINNADSGKTLKAIGSIFHQQPKDGDIYWGTGSIHNGTIPRNLDIDIRAVRGPLTRSFLIKNGYDCPEIYGDPALLMPDFYNPTIEKTNLIGIIPHVSEIDSPPVKSILKRNPKLKLIDIRLGHEEFIDELKSVEFVLSSSLHGLMMADAYHIRNAKIDIVGPQHKGSAWKYIDYFSSVNRFVYLGYIVNEHTDLKNITDAVPWNSTFNIDLEPLRNAFPYKILFD